MGPSFTVQCVCSILQFDELQQKIDRRTGKLIEEDPPLVKSGDAAMVKLVPQKPLVVETFAEYAPLGE